jgi:hypothetical protein
MERAIGKEREEIGIFVKTVADAAIWENKKRK